jgi:hypothetical protein
MTEVDDQLAAVTQELAQVRTEGQALVRTLNLEYARDYVLPLADDLATLVLENAHWPDVWRAAQAYAYVRKGMLSTGGGD